jgi:hypothetical protein
VGYFEMKVAHYRTPQSVDKVSKDKYTVSFGYKRQTYTDLHRRSGFADWQEPEPGPQHGSQASLELHARLSCAWVGQK